MTSETEAVMTDDPDAVPQQRAPLSVVRGTGTDGPPPLPAPVPPGSTGLGTPVPATVSTPVPLTVAERAGTAARRVADSAADVARELWLHPDRLVHSVVHGKPETMREHWAHVQSRSWVPEEMTGRPEKALILAGVLHHLLVAYPVKGIASAGEFACKKVRHAADRAITLYGLLAFLAALIFLIAHL
jgi:hypothetical protein